MANTQNTHDDMDGMDKFAVDEGLDQEELEKRAAKGCPICGRTAVRHGSVVLCPEHGSEPFEKG